MAYDANKPQPNNKISVSQGDLLGDFQAIGSILKFPAYPVTPGTVTLDSVGAVLPAAMDATHWGMYVAPSVLIAANPPVLWIQFPNVAPFGGGISEAATSNYATPGFTTLPSGIIIQWGYSPLTNAGDQAVVFNIDFPTVALNVTISSTTLPGGGGNGLSSEVVQGSLTVHGFSVHNHTGVARNLYYLAIGY